MVNSRGDSGYIILPATGGMGAVAQLISGTGSTSNAFNFRGRLQEYNYFKASFDILCFGTADAIYFYFGASSIPVDETDISSGALIIGVSIYNFVVEMKHQNPAIDIETDFYIQSGVWTPIVVQYTMNSTDLSFTVDVSVSGSPLISSSRVSAGPWVNSISGMNWGIGARTGLFSGFFSFKHLQVDTGASYCGAGLVSNCSAGSYLAEGAADLNSCVPCTAGWYIQLEGATSAAFCRMCPAGTYSCQEG